MQRAKRIKYRRAKFEINKLQQEIEMLGVDRDYVCHLGHTMAQYSLPSPVYSIFLKRELISLHARALVAGAPCYIHTIDQFLELYKQLDRLGKNLLYELFQHDLVVTGYNEWDPKPYVGDAHIKGFASFMISRLKWNKATGFVKKLERLKD